MKTAEHTPTPWAVGFSDGTGESYITAGDHPALKNAAESIAVVVSGGTDDWGVTHGVRKPEDARRIVACVNACAGIDTEVLEDVLPAFVNDCDGEVRMVRKDRSARMAAGPTVGPTVGVLAMFDKCGNPAHWSEARAAVAELFEAAQLAADYLNEKGIVLTDGAGRLNLRAALARVGGAE